MNVYIEALEADRHGDWDRAHDLIQDLSSMEAAWIHAYLHRKEGDDWNARYWYSRAGKPFYEGDLASEWAQLFEALAD